MMLAPQVTAEHPLMAMICAVDDLPPMPRVSEESCRRVWVAVLIQMIRDAASMSKKPEAAAHRVEAVRWLFGRQAERDFNHVCDLAGVEPFYVRRKVMEARERNFVHRFMPGNRARERANHIKSNNQSRA